MGATMKGPGKNATVQRLSPTGTEALPSKKAHSAAPRVVVVRRPTPMEALLARHGSPGQARFFLQARGQDFADVEAGHADFQKALRVVLDAVPPHWRVARLLRHELARFVFEPADVVVVVGQDGLVANVAKYLDGQRVVGVNPDPAWHDGVLVPHRPHEAGKLLRDAMAGVGPLAPRTLVEAELDDGQRLRALNEIFIGHATHQSARYTLQVGDATERHSSSGVVVSTGTGATGWSRSILRPWAEGPTPPHPGETALLWLVREAFPSVRTGTSLTAGRLASEGALRVVSELDEGGVIFGDGIEADHLAFGWGRTVTVRPSARQLMWVG